MQKSKQTPEEIEAIERAADNRRISRNNGFSLMSVRDRGWVTISEMRTGEVNLFWHIDRPLVDGEVRVNVPPGMIRIDMGGDKWLLFDAEELRKFLRWA
jgi:hypothetical protein